MSINCTVLGEQIPLSGPFREVVYTLAKNELISVRTEVCLDGYRYLGDVVTLTREDVSTLLVHFVQLLRSGYDIGQTYQDVIKFSACARAMALLSEWLAGCQLSDTLTWA